MEKKGAIKGLVIILIIALAGFGIYYFFQNGNLSSIMSSNFNSGNGKTIEASDSVVQFENNLRFDHSRISYFINPNCDLEKRKRFESALFLLSSKVQTISFYEVTYEKADILVGCSEDSYEEEKNVFIAGEGGPTGYINLSFYPVIKGGKVILYDTDSCDMPITEIHELLHVFGFDHISDKSKIMYPYVECNQIINPEVIAKMTSLYSIEPLPELYFKNIDASKKGEYLSFDANIANDGMKAANSVFLEVYEGSSKIDSTDLGKMESGIEKSFGVDNVLLLSKDVKSVRFVISYAEKEYDKINNVIEKSI